MAATNANNSVQEKNNTTTKAHAAVDKAAESAHKGVDGAASAAEYGHDQVEAVAQQISAQAHKMAETAQQQSERVSSAVSEYAKENPIKSVGFAFLAGAVAASLLCKRK